MEVTGINNGGCPFHVASDLLICKIGTVMWWHGLAFQHLGGGGGGGGNVILYSI